MVDCTPQSLLMNDTRSTLYIRTATMEYHLIPNHGTYEVWSDNGTVCELMDWFGNMLTAMNVIEDLKRSYRGAISSFRFGNLESQEVSY